MQSTLQGDRADDHEFVESLPPQGPGQVGAGRLGLWDARVYPRVAAQTAGKLGAIGQRYRQFPAAVALGGSGRHVAVYRAPPGLGAPMPRGQSHLVRVAGSVLAECCAVAGSVGPEPTAAQQSAPATRADLCTSCNGTLER